MKEPKDKRTKKYKDWKALQIEVDNPVYLGDTIAKVTKATGIDKLVKAVVGNDCGCDERREKLNKYSLPVRKKVQRCFTDEQLKQYSEYRERRTQQYNQQDVIFLIDLYAWIFAIQYDYRRLCINCSGSFKIMNQIEDNLDKVYESYLK